MIDLEADDDRLVTAFHRGTLTSFPHRDHVRVAWILLEQFGSDGALEAMRSGIRSMAIAAGLLAPTRSCCARSFSTTSTRPRSCDRIPLEPSSLNPTGRHSPSLPRH